MWAQKPAAVRLKRAYEPPAADDGTRVLVERLWPRGVTKGRAAIDHWLKDLAPSPELRRWYSHQTGRWPEFGRRYRHELRTRDEARAALETLRGMVDAGPVTLVFAAKDPEHSSAAIVADMLGGPRS
jgi:uncharacterized protein YeaO (DUF488 family)